MTSRGKLMVSLALQRGKKSNETGKCEKSNKPTKFADFVQITGTSVKRVHSENIDSDTCSSDSDISYDSDDSARDPEWKLSKKDEQCMLESSDDSDRDRSCIKKKQQHSKSKNDSVSQGKIKNQVQSLEASTVNQTPIVTTTNTDNNNNIHEELVDISIEENNSTQCQNPPLQVAEIEVETSNGPEVATDTVNCQEPKPKKAKKGIGNPETWTRNLNKKLRMEGKAYRGVKMVEGKKSYCTNRPERILSDRNCSRRCEKSRKCKAKGDEARKEIFTAFWTKMDWNEKKSFVANNVRRIESQKRSSESRRKFTYKYNLRDGDVQLPVCKEMFLSTLGISEHTVYEWLMNRDSSGLPLESEADKSARSKTRQSIFPGNESVAKFFEAIPKMPSHYCRASSDKIYIEPTYSSFTHLFKVYEDFAKNSDSKVAGIKYFKKVFDDMNLALFRPKKDQCDTCVGFETKNISEEIYQNHIRRKDEARQSKQNDKARALETDEVKVLSVDVQSVLLCPKVEASAIYYKTKLACHNFTIYDLSSKDVTCYFWHEGEGGLTSNTFASCINAHLSDTVKDNTKEVIIYSDGCGYQNRNVTLSNTLLRFAVRNKVTITQCYLEKGHTQSEVDSVHSVIERKIRRKPIYSPSNYVQLMEDACKKPYQVKYIDHTFFQDFGTLKYYDSIRPGFKVGDPVVTDTRCLKYLMDGIIQYKLSYSDEYTELPRRRNATIPTGDEMVQKLYGEPLKIKKSKYQHLQQLKEVIPKDYHAFYDALFHD